MIYAVRVAPAFRLCSFMGAASPEAAISRGQETPRPRRRLKSLGQRPPPRLRSGACGYSSVAARRWQFSMKSAVVIVSPQ